MVDVLSSNKKVKGVGKNVFLLPLASNTFLLYPLSNYISPNAFGVLVVQRFACIPENSFLPFDIIVYFALKKMPSEKTPLVYNFQLC